MNSTKEKKGNIQENSIMKKKRKQNLRLVANCQKCSIEIGGKCEEGQNERINVLDTVK